MRIYDCCTKTLFRGDVHDFVTDLSLLSRAHMGESRERYSLAGPYRPARPHQAAPTEGKMADCDEAALGTVDYANSIGVAGPWPICSSYHLSLLVCARYARRSGKTVVSLREIERFNETRISTMPRPVYSVPIADVHNFVNVGRFELPRSTIGLNSLLGKGAIARLPAVCLVPEVPTSARRRWSKSACRRQEWLPARQPAPGRRNSTKGGHTYRW
jgi:hypothetical protein